MRLFTLPMILLILIGCDNSKRCPYNEIEWASNRELTYNEGFQSFNSEVKGELKAYLKKIGTGKISISTFPQIEKIQKKYSTREISINIEYLQNYNALVNDLCGIIKLINDKEINEDLKIELGDELIQKVKSFYEFTQGINDNVAIEDNNQNQKIDKESVDKVVKYLLRNANRLSKEEIDSKLAEGNFRYNVIVYIYDQIGGIREEGEMSDYIQAIGDEVRSPIEKYTIPDLEIDDNGRIKSITLNILE